MQKIILRSDIENLGRLGDTVKVKPGYARNYLIPQGLAMPATEGNLRLFEQERKKLQARMDAVKSAAQTMADKLAATPIVIEVRVGEGDKLYGSVTTANIADALAAAGVEFDRKKIVLDEPIRALGEFEVAVKLHPDVRGAIKLTVTKPGGPDKPEAPVEEAAAESEQSEEDNAE
mgnify:CR=1 FL=1